MRVAVGSTVVTALLVSSPTIAVAVPPPPPNPSDSQLDAATAEASAKAGDVVALVTQLTAAQAALDQLTSDIGIKKELTNKARVDLERAQTAAASARSAQLNSQQQVTVAQGRIESARGQVDQFAAGSYQQGAPCRS